MDPSSRLNSEGSGFHHLFRSLRYKNFVLYFTGQGVSLVGTWMQQIAMSWLVYRLTHSSFLLGFVGFVNQFPTFLFASFGGVLVDRWNKHRILLITQTLAMIQALVLAALTATGKINVTEIIVLGLFLGTVNALDIPTRQAFLVDLIRRKEDLGNAIALNSSLVNAARLIGPSIAGILIAVSGEQGCFYVNAISFIAVLVALLCMDAIPPSRAYAGGDMWKQWKEGIRYAHQFKPIGAILALLSVVSLMGMSYAVLMPMIVTTVFHGGPRMLGFLMATSGIGALAGTFYLAYRKNILGLWRIIALASGLLGVALFAFSFSRMVWVSAVLLMIMGFAMIVQMASSNTILQTIVDDDKRGRVMSLYAMAFMGMAPLGSLLSGSLAAHVGPTLTIAFTGAMCVMGSLVFAKNLPGIRAIIRPVYVRLGIMKELSS